MLEKPMVIGPSAAFLTINDRTKESLVVSPFYHVRVTGVDGHYGTDRSIESHPIPQAIGERHGDNFKRGKTLTLSGEVWGRNLQNLREGQRALQAAFWSDAEWTFRFTEWDNSSVQLFYTVYVSQDLDMADQTPDHLDRYVAAWTVALRADNPRTYTVASAGATLYPTWQT